MRAHRRQIGQAYTSNTTTLGAQEEGEEAVTKRRLSAGGELPPEQPLNPDMVNQVVDALFDRCTLSRLELGLPFTLPLIFDQFAPSFPLVSLNPLFP